eukprot:TRINITY_DN51908_c0_g1_i1.p1 TRINITY_DN51908_c0_g1~~TRINITY_DN51908_c0_g1_i1.p1  ORF type:complete len:457 (+),score=107.67 TRINITY_DN51908_c0_g1_i1:48-1373(+)
MEAALRSCDAAALAKHVLEHLGGDTVAAAALLRAAAAEAEASAQARALSRKRGDVASATKCEGIAASELVKKETNAPEDLVVLQNQSLAVPRGRFDLVFAETGLSLHGKGKDRIVYGPIAWNNFGNLLKLPKPETYRKAGAPAKSYYVVLALNSGKSLSVGKQALQCIVLNADGVKPMVAGTWKASLQALRIRDGALAARISEAAADMVNDEAEHSTLAWILAAGIGTVVQEPEQQVCPLDSIRAYRGVDEGVLYPLRAGLCYLTRPSVFVPLGDIARITSGSGGGGSSLTDVVVERMSKGPPLTFSNVAKCDLCLLADFARFAAAERKANESRPGQPSSSKVDPVDDDDEEEDEDYADEEDSSEESAVVATHSATSCSASSSTRRTRQQSAASHAGVPVAKRTRKALAAAASAGEVLQEENEAPSDGELVVFSEDESVDD